MGALDKFERGVERAMQSVFAKAFKGEVQPVELASALRKEADTSAHVVGRDRILAPNAYRITLGASDYTRFANWTDTLIDELADSVTEHARQQRYSFSGPVSIHLDQNADLDTGVFQIRSAMVKGNVAPAATAAVATVSHPVLDVDGRRYQLSRPVTVLGRGTEADIVIDDPGVSRRHAEIHVGSQGSTVSDLNSTNGTFVDSARARNTRLFDGATITVGRTHITFYSGTTSEDDG